MAEFSSNIIDVYYFDQECTIINVEWRDEENKIRKFFVNVDENDQNYKDLVAEGWDADAIWGATKTFRYRARKAFEKECMLIAEKEGIISHDNFSFKKIWECLGQTEDQINPEKLFKFKIEVFENELVTNADRNVKRDIRQAKTYKQIIDMVFALKEQSLVETAETAEQTTDS
jgi:G:T-mismatch repair DNA endonuclease (very short patch repair protein)